MRVTIFGTGYVGLVQAAVLAEAGYDVMCVDIDPRKVAQLRRGEVLSEPGLRAPGARNDADAGRRTLRFTTDPREELDTGSDPVHCSIGTPPDEDGSADLKYVLQRWRQYRRA